MTSAENGMSAPETNPAPRKLCGVPVGDFGFFSSLFLALAVSMIAFWLATFFAIAGIMIYNGFGHNVNYADSYRLISFPIGCAMLAASLIFFMTLWLRRKFSGS